MRRIPLSSWNFQPYKFDAQLPNYQLNKTHHCCYDLSRVDSSLRVLPSLALSKADHEPERKYWQIGWRRVVTESSVRYSGFLDRI